MVILNGAVIVDTFLEELTPVGNPNNLGYKSRAGQIALAGHSDYVEFRNLKVADYTASPPTPESPADNTPSPGFTALFNGNSLCGWKGLAYKNANERRALKDRS